MRGLQNCSYSWPNNNATHWISLGISRTYQIRSYSYLWWIWVRTSKFLHILLSDSSYLGNFFATLHKVYVIFQLPSMLILVENFVCVGGVVGFQLSTVYNLSGFLFWIFRYISFWSRPFFFIVWDLSIIQIQMLFFSHGCLTRLVPYLTLGFFPFASFSIHAFTSV